MAAIFRCTGYPALQIRLGEKRFKFVGGRLQVADSDAAAIEAFAASRTLYGITREDAPEPPAQEPTREDELQAMTVPALRALAGDMELDTTGRKDVLVERILEAEAEATETDEDEPDADEATDDLDAEDGDGEGQEDE